MRKLLAALLAALSLTACKMETAQPNETVIFNYRPYFFGQAYLDSQAYHGPGRWYYWFGTSAWKCDNAPDTLTIQADDFMSRDRVLLDFDVAVTIGIGNKDACPKLLEVHGTTDHVAVFKRLAAKEATVDGKKIVTGEFLSYLREQVRGGHSAEFMAGQDEEGNPSDKASRVEKDSVSYLNKFLADNKAGMISVFNISLGRANPPEQVKRSIAETAAREQDVKTQTAAKRAEETRKLAEIARAEADLAYMNGMKLSPELYVSLKQIEACKAGATCIISTNGNGSHLPIAVRTK